MTWLSISIRSFEGLTAAGGRITQKLRTRLRVLGLDFLDPYRPERHYMRGPGPKYRERQNLI